MAVRALDATTLAMLAAAVACGVLALNFAWGVVEADFQGTQVDFGYRPLSMHVSAEGESSSTPYSGENFEDADGVGMVRAGGILLLIGVIVAGLAALAAEHVVILGATWLRAASAAVALVGAALAIVAVILLPMGISDLASSSGLSQFGDDVQWRFGLYAGIAAAALALAGTVTAAISWLRTSGFKLEPADEEPADFDA